MRKRVIALLLACVMTVSLLPVSALAVEPSDNNTAAQETTVITTAEEFAAMKPDGTYRLGADIAVDVPYDKTFTGSLDGAYHTVTLALHVTAEDTAASWGLFRALNGAAIRDLRLAGELAAAEDSPAQSVGALAGMVSGDTIVSSCRSEVQISVSAANSRVGGLVGSVTGGTLTLTGCANAGTVKALNSAAAGGLVGSVLSGSVTIRRSYQYGDVLGGVCAGGLVGQLAEQAECTASYSYAAVSADDKENADASALTLGRGKDHQRPKRRCTVRRRYVQRGEQSTVLVRQGVRDGRRPCRWPVRGDGYKYRAGSLERRHGGG